MLERFRLANTEFIPALSPHGSTANCFRIHQSAEAIEAFPVLRPLLHFRHVLQLTGEDVGSAALTTLVGAPASVVVVSTADGETEPLREFARRRGMEDRLRIFTGVDIENPSQLADIVHQEFGRDGLEIVLDERSDDMDTGRRVFEMLFPLLQVGGAHVIERWAWDHFLIESWIANAAPGECVPEEKRKESVAEVLAAKGQTLEALLPLLVDAARAHPEAIASVTASKHWLAVHRGVGDAARVLRSL
jgi:hypothetical protein